MARRNAKRVDEKYGVLRDISSNWSPTKAARLLVEAVDRTAREHRDCRDSILSYFAGQHYIDTHYDLDNEELFAKVLDEGPDQLCRRWERENPRDFKARNMLVDLVGRGGLLDEREVAPFVISPEMLSVVEAAASTLTASDLRTADFSGSPDGILLLPRPVTVAGTPTQMIYWSLREVATIITFGNLPGTLLPEVVGLTGAPPEEVWSTSILNYRIFQPKDFSDPERSGIPERLIFAFLRLSEQRTTAETVERVPADPGTPKRAPRAERDVRVTYLRRTSTSSTPAAKREVEWRSRWVVSMHKARQWYPKEQKHKIIFRGPYVKGPADKPLRSTPNVKALVR